MTQKIAAFPALALTALVLAACGGPGAGVRLTPQQQAEFADAMTQPDPLSSGQIPAADRFPGR